MDFEFLQDPINKTWSIMAPRRAKRPDVANGSIPVCPFCRGKEKDEKELYRIGGEPGDSNWKIRVIPNKFPFTSGHEIFVHSPDHHKNFDELPLSHTELILETYKERFRVHKKDGLPFIFHNRGEAGGESVPHPHSQLAIIPEGIDHQIPKIGAINDKEAIQTKEFIISCPRTSKWPEEVWFIPKRRDTTFDEITKDEIKDLGKSLYRIIQIMDMRHGHEFAFNFYIYPANDWYLRLVPRLKVMGGFEVGTGIFVNTQDPRETLEFIKEHFTNPDPQKIREKHRASYRRGV